MSKVTFYGLPAWVGAIHGSTVCDWWERDPAQINWNRALLHTIDLARSTAAAIAGQITIAQIEVDDHTSTGGRTTIGPLWPGGNSIGGVWVSDSYLTRNGLTAPGDELRVVQYFGGEQGNRRFHGFQARVLKTQGGLSLVELWNPGTTAAAAAAAGTWWLDLGADADPNTPAPSANQTGPLYLDTKASSQLMMFEPKLPPFRGGFALAG
jgi:hypothetical protein